MIATPVAGALGDKGAKWKLVWVGTLFMTIGLPIMWVATYVSPTLVPVVFAWGNPEAVP